MTLKREKIQRVLLKVAHEYLVTIIGKNNITEKIGLQFPRNERPNKREVMSAMWSCIAQRLLYIDMSDPAIANWRLHLTQEGQAAARDEEINPDSGEYLERLEAKSPDADPLVLLYAREALQTYRQQCYLASAVMLGVASEAAFLEMARSFGHWLPDAQRQKFLEIIENPKSNYIQKFKEFRKRIDTHKSSIPNELSDGMSLTLDSVLDLLRINRNDAGHPTGKQFDRQDASIGLQMFARYLEKLYALKTFFDLGRSSAKTP
ncbi:MAG: hypothetical protein ACE5HI_18765 [bacterium]